jgi:hypothetical protein
VAEHPYKVGSGLNYDNLEETTEAEIDAYLMTARRNRVPLYTMTANSVWLDNRPDIAKLHHRTIEHFRTDLPLRVSVMSFGHLYSYIYLGFEVGVPPALGRLVSGRAAEANHAVHHAPPQHAERLPRRHS